MEHTMTPFEGTMTSVLLFSKDTTLRYMENLNDPPIPYLEDMGLNTNHNGETQINVDMTNP